MKLLAALSVVVLAEAAMVAVAAPRAAGADDDLYRLPPNLLIGAGISATQAEGAWNISGKSESIMDRVVHSYGAIFPATNEVAADHYHRYKEDLRLARQLKFTSHRFSISWARVLPNGDRSFINNEAVEFYHNYIDEIKKNGMVPLVTMYHFDHPYSVEEETGGWTSSKLVDKFVDYADFLFETYGDKVKYWNPINEGNMYCIYVPPILVAAKLEKYDVSMFYKCLHNTILAHAKVYRNYKANYYSKQKGQVGTSALIWPGTPNSSKYEDTLAADRFNEVFAGTVLDPLVYGDYSASTRYLVDKKSKEMGLSESRLPTFTPDEKELLIKDGPATDFVALNIYTGYTVEYSKNASDHGNLDSVTKMLLEPIIEDMDHVRVLSGGLLDAGSEEVMRTGVLWSWNRYHLPIVITENGYGDMQGHGIKDYDSRGAYHSANIGALVRVANELDIPVISYHAWALLDVFEFSAGYDRRPFGLIHVDYKGGSLNRTLKESSKFFVEMAETGVVPRVSPSPSPPPASSTPLPASTPSPPSSASTMAPSVLVLLLFAFLRL